MNNIDKLKNEFEERVRLIKSSTSSTLQDKRIEEAFMWFTNEIVKAFNCGVDYNADLLLSTHNGHPSNGMAYLYGTKNVEPEVVMGVGDGSGNHYVKGEYDTIKLLQTKLLELEKLRFHTDLPLEEQKEYKEIIEYKGWDSVEQLEDVIGEETTTGMFFGEDKDGDRTHNYDLELTLRRIKYSKNKR